MCAALKLILSLFLIVEMQAKELIASPSGLFSIHQTYEGQWLEKIIFPDSKLIVELAGFPWPGHYSISPDERWILRIQKTGSGDNRAVLYQIEKNGRIMEIIGFDEMLWSTSNNTTHLRKDEMYHTGIDEVSWSKDKLTLILSGSNIEASSAEFVCRRGFRKLSKCMIRSDFIHFITSMAKAMR